MKEFSVSKLPSDPTTWPEFRKKVNTRALKIDGPFRVKTVHKGVVTCNDGYLAVDARGYPYPIATEEFNLIYESVDGSEEEE